MAPQAGAAPGLRLLLDEMWGARIARQLRDRGHDVVSVVERPDLRTKVDAVILAAALAEDRAVVTEDRGDYRRLGAGLGRDGRPYPALILTNNRRWPRANRRTLGRLVTALDALLASGAEIEGEHWLAPPD